MPGPRLRSTRLMAALAALAAVASAAGFAEPARDRLIVVGSSTVFPFGTAVAEAFGRKGRWKTPVVESIGTGGGFKLFCSGVGIGTPDINEASRPMTDSERETCNRNRVGPVVALRIGLEAIVIASSRRATPFDLTLGQLYRAVARTVPIGGHLVPNPYHRWSDLGPGLPNRPISIYGPASNHGTRDAFAALVMGPACTKIAEVRALPVAERTEACQPVREDGAWIDVAGDYGVLLGKLAGDPDAVAVFTYSYYDQNRDKIQVARLEGIAPAPPTILDFSYPAARPLFIYVKSAHVGVVPGLAELVQEYVSDAAASRDGYLVDRGLVPLPPAWLEIERRKATALAAAKP